MVESNQRWEVKDDLPRRWSSGYLREMDIAGQFESYHINHIRSISLKHEKASFNTCN